MHFLAAVFRILITFFALAVAHSAPFSLEATDPEDVCSRLEQFESACRALIPGAYFDRLAAGECDRYGQKVTTLTCMRIIRGHRFQSDAVITCDRIRQEGPTNRCLQAIASRRFSAAEIQACNAVGGPEQMISCFLGRGTPPLAPPQQASKSGIPKSANASLPPPVQAPANVILELPEDTYNFTWKSCQRADLGMSTLPFDSNNAFRPECAPDTLYVWVSDAEVERLSKAAKAGEFLATKELFGWRTPIGTFGMNTSQIRLKLKSGVHFVHVDATQQRCPLNAQLDQNTVYVAYLGAVNKLPGWTSYFICSSGPVASWSHDSTEGYREMVSEADWVQVHKPEEFDSIYRSGLGGIADCPSCDLFRFKMKDQSDFSMKRLEKNLAGVKLRLRTNPLGEVFYNEGIPSDRKAHFSTKTPSYFNPIGEK